MNPALHGTWEHIRRLGLGALAHANRHSNYAAFENDAWADLSVVQAAHAAELLIKARIAQEHPLLIFEELPKTTTTTGSVLELRDLFERGRTYQWSDLPDRLWATTGIKLPDVTIFKSFGRLRNGIQHFSAPEGLDLSAETVKFIYQVIDPFINECWNLFAVDYDEDHDPYVYLIGSLFRHEVPFLVSPGAAKCVDYWDVDWSAASPAYDKEMKRRLERTRKSGQV